MADYGQLLEVEKHIYTSLPGNLKSGEIDYKGLFCMTEHL